jgi:hypothetical protein
MIVWGGSDGLELNTGGRYRARGKSLLLATLADPVGSEVPVLQNY